MKKIYLVLAVLCTAFASKAQLPAPVNMSAQPNYTYTETFADIANWSFTTTPSADGTLNAGIGAGAWKGYAAGGTGTIPNGTRVTGATNTFQTPTSTSSGVYRFNQALGLLSTGTTDNNSAVAFDLFVNFSGLNAGTLSFDWATVNNLTGNRSSSLRIYTSTDGTNFTELPAAAVLNFTNNAPTSGRINFVSLPASFNGAANAQIRFYYYNGTGGSTGNRPKLSIDNVSVTAVPATTCSTPTAQPTNLTLNPGYSSITGLFSAAVPAATGYLVIYSLNNNLSSLPVDGQNYNIGDNVGDGTVISFGNATNFTITNLSPSTQYYFYVFAMNNLCSGGTKYLTATPLTAIVTTLSGSAPCSAPSSQPANLVLSNITLNSIKGSFTASAAPNADHYLVVRSTSSTLSSSPVNGTAYSAGSALGGGVVVTRTQQTTFTANNLASGTQYYFFVFAANEDNCTSGPAYNTNSPLTANATTTIVSACSTPTAQPTQLNLSANTGNITGYFLPAANVNGYLVVYSTSATLSATPQNGITYTTGAAIGNGVVLSNSSATAFIATGLTPSTPYYFYIFSKNDQCSGGPLYMSSSPLTGNATTTGAATYSHYFGNLHAHSSYSDGNKDNGSFTPADDYAYAKNSQCMDYLGISEHNHRDAGMTLANWQPGIAQAQAATTSNFLALYGMEWGVISNAGHVLVYGSNQLLGWDAGYYNQFVAKSDYLGTPPTTGTTGLFKTINDWPTTAFAMLAHPDNSDYGGIANAGLNPTADSAIAGCAIESGPAFSTVTNYTDAPARQGHYNYYKRLLSRGYHAGPTIDHDTHYTNFGRMNYSRVAVLSPGLTQADMLLSLKQRRFYSTTDCDTRVVFTLNNQLMGSILTGTSAPAISIWVNDPTNAAGTANATIRLMQGIAGSGLTPVAIDSATGGVFNYTDFNLANNTQAYYYAEISIGGGYVITSPVWYTRTNVFPVTLLNFTAKATSDKQVLLQWQTTNEINNQGFEVQRSADGVTFQPIGNVAANNITGVNNYSLVDKQPLNGINYYRLKKLDKDGKYTYSNTVAVNMSSNIAGIALTPNPVKDQLHLQLDVAKAAKANVNISDVIGRNLKSTTLQLQQGSNTTNMNVTDLPAGTYFLVIRIGTDTRIERFIKQ